MQLDGCQCLVRGCDDRLVFDRETWDEEAKVFVGFLTCNKCQQSHHDLAWDSRSQRLF